MTYKAKVDWWIALVIIAGIVFPAISAVRMHQPLLAATPVALTLFLLIAVYPQKYETTGDALRIRAGLTTRTIPWSAISKVSPAEGSGASLVLSMDRIVIEYSGSKVLIAPTNQAQFFDDVASHCPQLSPRGMDLAITLN